MNPPRPTRRQYRITREVTRWYLNHYFRTPADIGLPRMFCDPEMVGYFAVDGAQLARGDGAALFKLLVTMTMFQRRSDAQIMRVLRGISREDADELTDMSGLLTRAAEVPCEHLLSTVTLKEGCDLSKDKETKLGVCSRHPDFDCYLKRHTTLLKRYGHFGKVPTSAALMVRDNGASSLANLKTQIWREARSPLTRAGRLIAALSMSWRVSEKIASMFLSAVTNPDLSSGLSPWSDGVKWTEYIVIDSNVDLYLRGIGYPGPWTYRARREFIQQLAQRVPLDQLENKLHRYNPRLVQQALYMFKSALNRRGNQSDCSHRRPKACTSCHPDLARICTLRGV